MNKEEIEDIKAGLRILYEILLNEHREGTYTIQRILEYINYLEQKETILDKITDKLNKEQYSDYKALNRTEYRLRRMSKEEYNKNGEGRYLNDLRESLLNRIEYQQEILNIIEEKKKGF